MPNELEEDLEDSIRELKNGDYDYVEALYSNKSINSTSDGTRDPHKINKYNFPTEENKDNITFAIKALVPEGFKDPFSLDTNREARFCLGPSHKC